MNKQYIIITILILSLMMVSCSKTENKEASSEKSSNKTTEITTTTTTKTSTETETTTSTSKETENTETGLSKMTLEEIIANLTKDLEMPMTENMNVEKDWYPSYVFVDYIDGSEALANESLMSSVAHSAVIIRLPEGSDVEKIRAKIEKNADPVKWICVGAEKKEVVSNGNHILLVMSFEDITDTMVERFMEMK